MMTAPVFELDDVIRRYAWGLLLKRVNFFRRFLLDESNYYCEVDWSCLNQDHHVSKFDIRPEGVTFTSDWGSIKTGVKWIPLYSCDFENRTENKQAHTFRGTRETTTWISVELAQGYTVSNAVDVDVTVPAECLHFRAGRDTGFKVTRIKGDVFKEVLNWEVSSQVEVIPSWKANAKLLARQESHVVDFEVRTTLTVPNGVLPVYFRRRSDKSIAFVVKVDKLEQAFQTKENGGVLTPEEQSMVHTLMEAMIDEDGKKLQSGAKLQLITRGTFVCVAWSDQKVDIKTAPLSVSNGEDGDVVVQELGVLQASQNSQVSQEQIINVVGI